MPTSSSELRSQENKRPAVFAGLVGAWLGLALIKFGNPVILDRMIEPPGTFWEFVISPWPVAWGYFMLVVVLLAGLTVARFTTQAPAWIIAMPLVWFGWQLAAATGTVDASLTRATLLHFAACVSCFYLGLFALSRVSTLTSFWLMLLVGFAWVIWAGFDQHFGGLEATQRWFHSQPNWQEYPPEYVKRIGSDRIFSTLVYPNALAGAILFFLPILLVATFRLTERANRIVRGVSVGLLGYTGLACLYWSGSKAGWLIAMLLALVVMFRLPLRLKTKVVIVGASLVIGFGGFFVKFSNYFQRGATSVGARFDYWRAAWKITIKNPIIGTGPGTFSVPYKQIKAAESEITRLVHNNYLEQASDSGIPGFLAYLATIMGSIVLLYRKCASSTTQFTVWIGLLAWTIHGFVEFGLYIPALAWPAFLFFGWLWGTEAE